MDEADISDDGTGLAARAVNEIRKALAKRELEPMGACHYCNEYVRGMELFCCKECADDHASLMAAQIRNGR